MHIRTNTLKIDLSALVFNLKQVKSLVGSAIGIMGVVKSDAYGHGLLPVSRTLEASGVACLGVANLDEALKLRDAGIRLSIVILCGVQTREECRAAAENDLTPVVFDYGAAELLAQESARLNKITPVHLKIDTGMGRLGISSDALGPFLSRLGGMHGIEIQALISHLSSADNLAGGFTKTQIARFKDAINFGRSVGLELPLNNLANSAGVLGHPESHFDLVRPGIMLYGGNPSTDFDSPVPLKPVMSFTGHVLQIKTLPDQSPVSYGRSYYTQGLQKIAVLSAGYGDGLPRGMSNEGAVLIGGEKRPILGRICMNLTISDVTGLSKTSPGDEAVFLGRYDDEIITGDDIARWAGTISYEVFCSLGRSNRKTYLK
jgi:alanine racemase